LEKERELPMKIIRARTQGSSVSRQGSWNVNVEKNASMPLDQATPAETLVREESKLHYTSESYQKILDYHVSEILLTTIVFGIILLLRFHH
jgi:hypothetical protein